MSSIESLRLDFDSQAGELAKINNNKLFDDCVFVGSGDSYVAGLIAEFITEHRCVSYSPSDLSNSRFLDGKTYCFVSVTGKTKSNIDVAVRAAKTGVKTVAVTMNSSSKLAQVCNETVPLLIRRTNTPTAGFSSFVANVVTCLQLAGIKIPQKYDTWHKNGIKISHDMLESATIPEHPLFVLGNNILYALAFYASLQMAEFFGTTAVAHRLEEFCHSPIFGLKKSHRIWILGQNEENIKKRLDRLSSLDLSYFELFNKDVFSELFESIFCLQSLLLLLAEKYGYKEVQYVLMKDVLSASSDIIYAK